MKDVPKDKKTPLLFLHGYLADKNCFKQNILYLRKYFDVYALDLKGFGENKDMPYPYALRDYADDVKRFLVENNINRPHVVAHSFGARIAVLMAAENPRIFDKLVLTGAAGLKPKFSLKKCINKTLFKILKHVLKKEKLLKFYSDDYKRLSPIMRESFIKIVNEHLDDKAKKITNPTLLIFGKSDKETPCYMAKRYNKKIKVSSLYLIDNAGHFAFLDNPYLFNEKTKEFLLS